MSKTPRPRVPEDVSAQVQFMANRTCCVCREPGKAVQIHHLDEDPSNNSLDNLAVLCLQHHNDTQLKGGFGRKLDAGQVRLYRDEWYEMVNQQRRDKLVAVNEELFSEFSPDYAQNASLEDQSRVSRFSDLERERVSEYQRNHGLFLVHSWRPSENPKQVADIVIRLHQHNLGALGEGKVDGVEYQLGPRFFTEPVVVADPTNDFELEVSAYRPMLCLAKVRFNDGRSPVTLSTYIDFPVEEQG
jgi:hypothetical protein